MTDEYEAREQDALEIARESRAENDARYAPAVSRPVPFGLSARARFVCLYDDGARELWEDGDWAYSILTPLGIKRADEREAAREQQERDDVDWLNNRRWDTLVNRYLDESHYQEQLRKENHERA